MLVRRQNQHLQNMFSGHCGSRSRFVSMVLIRCLSRSQIQNIVHSVKMSGLAATSTTFTNSMQCLQCDYVCSTCFCHVCQCHTFNALCQISSLFIVIWWGEHMYVRMYVCMHACMYVSQLCVYIYILYIIMCN
jgi:hypothetical protein